jgi:hypothetical protein
MEALSFSFVFLNDVGFLIKDEKEGAGKFFNDGRMDFPSSEKERE